MIVVIFVIVGVVVVVVVVGVEMGAKKFVIVQVPERRTVV